MCDKCDKTIGNDLMSELLKIGNYARDPYQYRVLLASDSKKIIKNGNLVEDKQAKEPIAYLELIAWHDNDPAEHQAIEINYCPFCGRML